MRLSQKYKLWALFFLLLFVVSIIIDLLFVRGHNNDFYNLCHDYLITGAGVFLSLAVVCFFIESAAYKRQEARDRVSKNEAILAVNKCLTPLEDLFMGLGNMQREQNKVQLSPEFEARIKYVAENINKIDLNKNVPGIYMSNGSQTGQQFIRSRINLFQEELEKNKVLIINHDVQWASVREIQDSGFIQIINLLGNQSITWSDNGDAKELADLLIKAKKENSL